jgi:hypothetical protein
MPGLDDGSDMIRGYQDWLSGARRYNTELHRACKTQLGVSLRMFKFTKNIVHLGSLILAGYAINEGAEPFIALLFAALIISGPEILEWWLVNQDYTEFEQED